MFLLHLLCLLSVLLFFGKSSFDPTALLARARPLVSSKPTAQPPRGPWTHWPTCLTPIAPFHLRMERGNRRAYCLLFGTFGTTVATFGIWDVGPFYVPGSFGPSPFGHGRFGSRRPQPRNLGNQLGLRPKAWRVTANCQVMFT